jgi:cell division protein FtsB
LRLAILFLLVLVVASVMGNRSLLRLYQMHRDRAALEREIDS